MDLNLTWFVLVFVLLIGYAILDGFDLGVGVLHAFARGEKEKRISINSIAPVWDGNEVWLLTGGGALFAAFPPVYASVFSGFYLALMLLLVALIFRAVSMEFRSKVESAGWRKACDVGFIAGSVLAPILLGTALGNILRGIPLSEAGDYTGGFFALLHPYCVLIGVLTLVVFCLHGAIWLAYKSEGEQQERVGKWIRPLWWTALALFLGATFATVWVSPWLFDRLGNPLIWILAAVTVGGFIGSAKLACGCVKQYGWAFVCSGVAIAGMIGLAATSLFPRLVPASNDLSKLSLTAYAHSSSPGTLKVMFIIALVGMPIVIAYTAVVYHIFKGKVVLTEESY